MTIEIHGNLPLRERAGPEHRAKLAELSRNPQLYKGHAYRETAKAVELLKQAANTLYMIGDPAVSPDAVAWGEKIDALLGGGVDGRGPQPAGQGGLLEFLKGLK